MSNESPALDAFPSYIQDNWEKSSYTEWTPIQEKVIPPLLNGENALFHSPTGTGKTVAYLLPSLQKIDESVKQTQVLIVVPTRELAMQVAEQVKIWTQGSEIKSAAFIGGANIQRQLDKLKKAVHVVVGTPGRLDELKSRKKLKLHALQTFIADETDQLLQKENTKYMQSLLKDVKRETQLVYTSATVTKEVRAFAERTMEPYQLFSVEFTQEEKDRITHLYIVSDERDKIDQMRKIVNTVGKQAIVFVNNADKLEEASGKMNYRHWSSKTLHAQSSKEEREKSLKAFRNEEIKLLLASDVAARGLDIEELPCVISLDLPFTKEQYTHRAGRTGRMGREGLVITLCTPREESIFKRIAKEADVHAVKAAIRGGELVEA